jgi:hypothetical protein
MSRRPAVVAGCTSRDVPVAIDRTYATGLRCGTPYRATGLQMADGDEQISMPSRGTEATGRLQKSSEDEARSRLPW